MRTRFSNTFFLPDIAPPVRAEASRPSRAAASPVLYAPARYGNIPNFRQHADFPKFEREYRELIDRLPAFVAARAGELDPPVSEARQDAIRADCETFKGHLFEPQGFFSDHANIMYGSAKEMLAAFADKLSDERIALRSRIDAVANLSSTLAVCAGGVTTAITDGLYQLRMANTGIKGQARRMMKAMAVAAILSHVKASHEYSANFEVHLVNHYFNRLADKLGLPEEPDPFAPSMAARVTDELARRCEDSVFAVLKPGLLINRLADDYFTRVRDAVGASPAQDVELGPGQLATLNDLKQNVLDPEYGDISTHSFVHADDETGQCHLWRTSAGIAEKVTQLMRREELIDFDKAITLAEDAGDGGAIMQLGPLFWTKDKDGRCDPLEARRLLDISPLTLNRHPEIEVDDLPETMSEIAGYLIEQTDRENLQACENAAQWIGEFVQVMQAVPRVASACARQVLFLGASFGNPDVIQEVLQLNEEEEQIYKDVDIEGRDPQGRTALMLAAAGGHTGALQTLIERGADIEAVTPNKDTALHLAAHHGQDGAISHLLTKGANIDALNGSHITPAGVAAGRGQLKALHVLIKNGAELTNVPLLAGEQGQTEALEILLNHGIDEDQQHRGDRTVLMAAAGFGHVAVLEMLLKKGADPGIVTASSPPALHLAAEAGHAEALRILLHHGVLPDLRGHHGATAAICAARQGKAECLRILIDRGADINAEDDRGYTALLAAAEQGHVEAFRVALEGGASITARTVQDHTAAMLAASVGSIEMLQRLLQHEADLHLADGVGKTAMMYAAEAGKVEALRFLLDQGAPVDGRTSRQWSALMYAAIRGHGEALGLLIERGADVNAPDNNGTTPLMLAARGGHPDAIRLLVEAGAIVDAADNQGATPLIAAALANRATAVVALLEAGADIHAQASDGRTAVIAAAEQGHTSAFTALFKPGVHDVEGALLRASPAMLTGIESMLRALEPDFKLEVLRVVAKGLRGAIASEAINNLDAFITMVNNSRENLSPTQKKSLLTKIRGAQKMMKGICNSRQYHRLKTRHPEFHERYKAMKTNLKHA
ncbi:ankyrin repeat domain-containing protein [Noviherbaspirillum aridicola]|uniref:Ankyrin repeat protein n=1 Tax=Noviherbaspirillum aridicola TaxID=2849687 RepID=A0ABQ4Q9F0_9BURK|nr:ankyrin repeat domain-containing protein [Noviherbaspirillum aridicola]GIZ53849.1 hypothetical protein NCCP691_38630 [Noviherbaspirillum aridicola]